MQIDSKPENLEQIEELKENDLESEDEDEKDKNEIQVEEVDLDFDDEKS